MANSKVQHAARPVTLRYSGNKSSLIPITVTLDTAADFTVYTPTFTDSYVAVLGFLLCETTATNLIIKSGSTELITLELAANSGFYHPVDGSIMLMTAIGENLVLNSSAGTLKILVHVEEIGQMQL